MKPWISALALAACGVPATASPRFEPARLCSMCHSNIPIDSSNAAPYALWLGSMKANASRDPYWLAKVREEVALNPLAAAVIENKCLSCHAPAQQYAYRGNMEPLALSKLNVSGEEGVTCTVCHQIGAAGLGTKKSFTAGFLISDTEQIFGPHANPFAMPMLHHTGYEPTQAKHILDAALCGTCHTVITPVLNENGKSVGEFVEQAPYLEWLVSSYPAEGRTCQSCHMPQSGTPAYIAHRPPGGPFPPTSPRLPFGRHSFSGANVRGAEMLAEVLPQNVDAFAQASARASAMLSTAVDLKLSVSRKGSALELTVDVKNLAGHKLPTAYPSRRLWLHVKALDADGQTVFESGALDRATGEIRGAGGDQGHLTRISSPGQVMIYEAEHEDGAGKPAVSLVRAAKYRKDNRLLPRGFDLRKGLPDGLSSQVIAPIGTAGDSDFLPGSDRVLYVLPNNVTHVTAEALYQSIKPSHAATTGSVNHPDSQRFGELYRLHRDPVVAARSELRTANFQ